MILRCFAVLAFSVCLLTNSVRSVAADSPLVDDVGPFKAALVQKLDDRKFAELETIERELLSTKARFAEQLWQR